MLHVTNPSKEHTVVFFLRLGPRDCCSAAAAETPLMPTKGSCKPTSQPAVALATCSSQSQALRKPQCTCRVVSENNKLQACSLHLRVVHDMICLTDTCWRERLAPKQNQAQFSCRLGQNQRHGCSNDSAGRHSGALHSCIESRGWESEPRYIPAFSFEASAHATCRQ